MALYNKKGSEVQASLWSQDKPHPHVKNLKSTQGPDPICRFCKNKNSTHGIIQSNGNLFKVCPGDYILEASGQYYPMSPDVFKSNFH